MPITPLHYCVAYLIGKWKPSLSLPGLIVCSMVPDLDIIIHLFINGFERRGILHSLFGVGTLGTALSVLLTVYAYPGVVSSVFNMDKGMIKKRCQFSTRLVLACFGGGVLHVLVDSLHHENNPLLYPFINKSFDALVLFGNWRLASMIVQSVFFLLLSVVFVWEATKGTEDFWKRMLVDLTALRMKTRLSLGSSPR